MTLYVRSRNFDGDGYTSYWSSADHRWLDLGGASVFTEAEKDSISKTTGLVIDARGHHHYVPLDREAEWSPLPEMLSVKEPAV